MPNKDIFLVENAAQLILSAIETHDFPGRVFSERINNLYTLLDLDQRIFFSIEEEKFLTEMVTLLEELINENTTFHSPDNIKKWFNHFLKALYEYIMLRASTILKHISQKANAHFYQTKTSDSPKIYCSYYSGDYEIIGTFKNHARGRKVEIRRYFRSSEFQEITQILHELVPGILTKTETFTDVLHEGPNIFSEPGHHFVMPPFIKELAETTKFLRPYYLQTTITKEQISRLEALTTPFINYVKAAKIRTFLQRIYTPIEYLSHWPLLQPVTDKHRLFLHICLMFNCFFGWQISYDLQERNDNRINMAINKIKRNIANKRQLVEAARTLVYSNVPWLLLRNLGMYSFHSSGDAPGYNKSIIYSAINEIAQDYTEILAYLRRIVNFEIDVISNNLDYANLTVEFKPVSESNFVKLKIMSDYAGDIIFLNKIISTLDGLEFDKHFTVVAMLRILGILGECAKNVSSLTKSFFNNRFMFKLAEIRDKVAHIRGFSRSLQKTLQENLDLMDSLKDDFHHFLKEAKTIIKGLPQTWDEIKEFYQKEPPINFVKPSKLGQGLNKTLEYLDTTLTPNDRAELRNTKHTRQMPDLVARALILSVLKGSTPAIRENKDHFFVCVDNLTPPLSNKQNQSLKEAYKKNVFENKPIKINETILNLLENITVLDETQLEQEIEILIADLKRMNKIDNLKERLVPLGLLSSLYIWEEKRKKYFAKPVDVTPGIRNNNNNNISSNNEDNSPNSKDQLLQESVNAAKRILRYLDDVNQLTLKSNRQDRLKLDEFWHNPMLCFAVEYHFTQIRVNIDAIQDALTHLEEFEILDNSVLALNTLYRILATKLDQVRLYGNGLAHLHDITEIDTSTDFGRRYIAYNQLYLAIDGFPYGNNERPSHFPSLYKEIARYIQEISQTKFANNKPTVQSVHRDKVSAAILAQQKSPKNMSPANYLTKAEKIIPAVESKVPFIAVIFNNSNLAKQFSQTLHSIGFSTQDGQPLLVHYPDPDENEYSVHISDTVYNTLLNNGNAYANLISHFKIGPSK